MVIIKEVFAHLRYGKCSKILNTSCLPKRPRQTGQTQIRLLLMKQSDPCLPCLLFCQAFCEFQPWKPSFYMRTEREKCLIFLEHLPNVPKSCMLA